MTLCPCGSGKDLDDCCRPYIDGASAPTAEALMRSRYTAFVLGELDHVERTHAPEAQGDFVRAELEQTAREVKWVGLEILRTSDGGEGDDTGTVEFAAKFQKDGATHVHHELSSFRRVDGAWAYVDGTFGPVEQRRVVKVGRNDPCPCGSGKKYKKCCGA